MIRRATEGDVPDIVQMARAFHEYSPWKVVEFDQDAVTQFIGTVLEQGAIFRTDTGMCGGLITPFYFNPAFKMAVEFCWWAPQGGGQALRSAFEEWATEAGASAVQFSALADDMLPIIARKYRAAGYSPTDTAFVKRLY